MKASPYLFFNCPLTYSCEQTNIPIRVSQRVASSVNLSQSQIRSRVCDFRNLSSPLRARRRLAFLATYLRLFHGYVHVSIETRQNACASRRRRRHHSLVSQSLSQSFSLSSRAARAGRSAPETKRTSVIHPRVELDQDLFPLDRPEEIRRALSVRRAHRSRPSSRAFARRSPRRRRQSVFLFKF